jgi:hypothetical protein
MIPAVAGMRTAGLAGLMTGVVIGGLFHILIGTFIGRLRFALPPLVTGLIVLMIGLALVKVGIQYAAGGVPLMGKPEFGSLAMWTPALVVIVVTLVLKFFTRGMMSVAAVLIGLIAGYLVTYLMSQVSFGNVARAGLFELPTPFNWGIEFNAAIIIGMCFMAVISAIEIVGDVSGICKGGAGREATDAEIQGATYADGVGTAVADSDRGVALSMAIAIASGATPAQGLYTAIVGGFLVSLLGGSRFQVGGPAGAFIVLVASTVALHGMDGLILATFLSGLMLAIIGFLRLGTFIKFIPFPVTVGFTAGIAVIKRGHRVTEVGPWELGRVCAVQKRDGLFYAASTPRHMQGYAIAR